MSSLSGKVALVTGGSRGIGAAIARRLAAEGADVAITYVTSAQRAEAVAGEIERGGRRALAIAADSADPHAVADAVERTVAELGRLDILVNNAGVFPYGPPEAVTLDELDRTLAVNVRAVFAAIATALKHLPDDGRIVTIGSCVATHVADPGMALYAMSKAALAGLTRGLARDLGPRGITVNVVDPGPIDTDMNPAVGPAADHARTRVALGRYGEAEDVAATVAHLAGLGGRYITGAAIAVDGGYTA